MSHDMVSLDRQLLLLEVATTTMAAQHHFAIELSLDELDRQHPVGARSSLLINSTSAPVRAPLRRPPPVLLRERRTASRTAVGRRGLASGRKPVMRSQAGRPNCRSSPVSPTATTRRTWRRSTRATRSSLPNRGAARSSRSRTPATTSRTTSRRSSWTRSSTSSHDSHPSRPTYETPFLNALIRRVPARDRPGHADNGSARDLERTHLGMADVSGTPKGGGWTLVAPP